MYDHETLNLGGCGGKEAQFLVSSLKWGPLGVSSDPSGSPAIRMALCAVGLLNTPNVEKVD